VLGGAAAASAALVIDPRLSPASAATGGGERAIEDLTFESVPPEPARHRLRPTGYQPDTLIRWGDRILPEAPEFNVYRQTAKAQAGQFGYNCDYVGVLPIDGNHDHCMLVVNHEYTNPEIMFPADHYTSRREAADRDGRARDVGRGDHPGQPPRLVAPGRAEEG
jgi:secreted PhoX family phosphatase